MDIPCKRSTHYRRLTVEYVFRSSLLELGIPHETHSVRVVRGVIAVVVRSQHQLGVDGRPV